VGVIKWEWRSGRSVEHRDGWERGAGFSKKRDWVEQEVQRFSSRKVGGDFLGGYGREE